MRNLRIKGKNRVMFVRNYEQRVSFLNDSTAPDSLFIFLFLMCGLHVKHISCKPVSAGWVMYKPISAGGIYVNQFHLGWIMYKPVSAGVVFFFFFWEKVKIY